MNAFGDRTKTLWAVIHGIHRCDHSEKDLRCANVTRGLVATDVLLARLQRESISGASFGIVRNANKSAGHVTFVLIARGEVCRVRATKPEGNAEALRVADCHIGSKFPRRFQ